MDISDHYSILIICKSITSNHFKNKYYTIINNNMLNRKFKDPNWKVILESNDVNICLSRFYKIYNVCTQSTFLKINNKENRRRSPLI